MNSINQNQPEHNRKDLRGGEAIQKIREFVEESPTCFFCTAMATGDSSGARPMNVRKVDDQGHLWFLSAKDSHTNRELAIAPAVRLYFQGPNQAHYLHLSGRASISTDREKIEELWTPIIRTWFTQGIDDPRITVLRITPSDGYYWGTKNGGAIAFAKMLVGAALGVTLDDSIEGALKI